MIAATMPPSAPPSVPVKKDTLTTLQMFGLIGEIGYTIAIPAVLLGFGGAYLDKTIGTSPLFFLVGLILALASSTLAIWHRIKPLLQS